MPSFFKIQKNSFFLIILLYSIFISPTNSLLPFKSNIKENIINKNLFFVNYHIHVLQQAIQKVI